MTASSNSGSNAPMSEASTPNPTTNPSEIPQTIHSTLPSPTNVTPGPSDSSRRAKAEAGRVNKAIAFDDFQFDPSLVEFSYHFDVLETPGDLYKVQGEEVTSVACRISIYGGSYTGALEKITLVKHPKVVIVMNFGAAHMVENIGELGLESDT